MSERDQQRPGSPLASERGSTYHEARTEAGGGPTGREGAGIEDMSLAEEETQGANAVAGP